MEDPEKYLIHADVTANGVVERSDVVGAIFGQTEGLLGDELDLRHLQESSKVGRIDVDVESEGGRSFGEVTIATSLDRVETAVLAASLETIDRVGPCRAELRITGIEDVRAAKRRAVVERAKELLAESFDESAASSQEILREVRQAIRVEDVTDYEGLPAGPHVVDSDGVILVEGRADVLQLLQYGIKNAVAVEGTDVPDAVATLTADRTTTAFLDGDRGGDLILRELGQVADVDYVALAPPDRSVEDLSRAEVMDALREKVPFEVVAEEGPGAAVPTDGGTVTADPSGAESSVDPSGDDAPESAEPGVEDVPEVAADAPPAASDAPPDPDDDGAIDADAGAGAASAPARSGARAGEGTDGVPLREGDATVVEADAATVPTTEGTPTDADGSGTDDADETAGDADGAATDADGSATSTDGTPEDGVDAAGADDEPPAPTLREHVEAVLGRGSGTVRLLDADGALLAEAAADEAFAAVEGAEPVPTTVLLDGPATQRLLDVAGQRGVGRVLARERGEVVKTPAGVRVQTADQLLP